MILRMILLFVPGVVWSQYNYGQRNQQAYGSQQRGYGQQNLQQLQQNDRSYIQTQNRPQQMSQQSFSSSNQLGGALSRRVGKQVLTPYNMSQYNNIEINNGVTIQFQLRDYSNPQFSLPNGWTCVCPSGFTCSYLNTPPSCHFSFTFIVSAPDTSVRYLATDFVTLDPSGSLPSAQQNAWAQIYVIQLPNDNGRVQGAACVHLHDADRGALNTFRRPKLSAIDIFAHNLGAVINQADGTLVSVDTLTHADTFVVPLSNVVPAVGGVQSMTQQHSYQGKLLGTTLYLSYSIACSGSLIGPNCDLTCKTSTINSNTAACQSNSTGFYYVCNYQSGGQVDNCKSCPWGIKEDTYCQDEGGGVLDPYHAGVVSSGFRTATIILSVLALIMLLLLILLLIALCIMRNRRKPKDKEMMSFEHHNGSASTRPLLTAAYRAEQPTPLPRSQPPSLDAKPAKSSMRKAITPPDQYDSRDTSFNSDSPMGMRQSRSAVV